MSDNIPGINSRLHDTLRRLHPDPFVQGALWRLFIHAPEVLEPGLLRRLNDVAIDDLRD